MDKKIFAILNSSSCLLGPVKHTCINLGMLDNSVVQSLFRIRKQILIHIRFQIFIGSPGMVYNTIKMAQN